MTEAIAAVAARVTAIRELVGAAAPTSVAATSGGSATDFDAVLAVLGWGGATGATAWPDGGAGTGSAAGTGWGGRTVWGAGLVAGGAGGVPGSGGATGSDLVAAAGRYLGVPYVWGGESLAEGGLDCSGLVQRSLADLGVTGVPRTAREQAALGTEVASLAQARPGDLVVFDGGTHIGIYVGGGRMIDAPKPGRQVTVREVYQTPTTIRRVLPAATSVGGSGVTGAVGAGAATTGSPAWSQAWALAGTQRVALGLGGTS